MPIGVHLAVVDPGVGGSRRALALRDEEGRFFVGPDNGLLIPAADRAGIAAAHELANPEYALETISRTFHGRDLFAPAAAHLSLGVAIEELGPPLDPDALVRLDLPQPELGPDKIAATVLYVDSFGNVALNVTREHIAEVGIVPGTQVELELGGERFFAVAARTFADARPGDIMLYEDSYRNMSVAISNGNAGEMLRARAGPVAADQRRPPLTCSSHRRLKSPSTGRSRSGITVPDVLFAVLLGMRRPAVRPRTRRPRAARRRGRAARRRAAGRRAARRSGAPPRTSGSGNDIAGWPVTLNAAVNGVNRAARSNCSQGSSGSVSQPTSAGGSARVGVSSRS